MKLNEKLVKLRKEQGLSQEEFGNKINVSRQAVSKWESEQTKPDIDKIKEIAKFFNVSFDYLLNDEIDVIDNKVETNVIKENIPKMKNKKIVLKIILIIILIYLLICIYKFIVLFRYYKIADSFSEENYWMSEIWEDDGEMIFEHFTKKVGNKIIIETSNPFDEKNPIKDENGDIIPYHIEFIDWDKDIAYELIYDNEKNMYIYMDRKKDAQNEKELNAIMCKDMDLIKYNTFCYIPSNFKNILLSSINPMYQVSLKNREIYANYFNRAKYRTILTKDCLVESYSMQTEFDGSIRISVSYDYVQDHFSEIQSPLEKLEDKIENYDEINLNNEM